MRKSVLFFVSVFLVFIFAVSGGAGAATPQIQSDAASPAQQNAAIELVKQLSLCVDMGIIGVDADCVRNEFFPLLGLNKNDRVLYGRFGVNTDGRWFGFIVKKVSSTGKTSSFFDVTFDFERTVRGEDGLWKTRFEIGHKQLFGKIPKNDPGLVHVYDRGRGYYLTEDASGNVAMDVGLEKIQGYYSADSLLQKHRTIGELMGERLTALEKADKGGPLYSKEAQEAHDSFSEMDSTARPHQIKFKF